MWARVLLLLVFSLLVGCDDAPEVGPYEGDDPGECSDNADNDRDGLFDCLDPDCAGALVCAQRGDLGPNDHPDASRHDDGVLDGDLPDLSRLDAQTADRGPPDMIADVMSADVEVVDAEILLDLGIDADPIPDLDVDAELIPDLDVDAEPLLDLGVDADVPDPGLTLGIPAYFYPGGGEWVQATAAPQAFGALIANPHNGPGDGDANYTEVINRARAAGIRVVGYVYTGYGTRDAATVRADIDQWYRLYTIDGIFFDEVAGAATCAEHEARYRAWAEHVRTHDADAEITINPGVPTCESYLGFTDIMMIFEDTADRFAVWTMPPWTAAYDASRFWVLVHDTARGQLDAMVAHTAEQNIGRVYITDDGGGNPWDSLPEYWNALLRAL